MAAPVTDADFNFYVTIGAKKGYWIGVTDIAVEGEWRTLDGKKYTGLEKPGYEDPRLCLDKRPSCSFWLQINEMRFQKRHLLQKLESSTLYSVFF